MNFFLGALVINRAKKIEARWYLILIWNYSHAQTQTEKNLSTPAFKEINISAAVWKIPMNYGIESSSSKRSGLARRDGPLAKRGRVNSEKC